MKQTGDAGNGVLYQRDPVAYEQRESIDGCMRPKIVEKRIVVGTCVCVCLCLSVDVLCTWIGSFVSMSDRKAFASPRHVQKKKM